MEFHIPHILKRVPEAIFISLFSFVLLLFQEALPAQEAHSQGKGGTWFTDAAFHYDFLVTGYVRVREFSYAGDKLDLGHDLGMKQWSSISLEAGHEFRNSSVFSGDVEYFFFQGHAVTGRDVWFNSTHLEGSSGLSVNATTMYQAELRYEIPLKTSPDLRVRLVTGLVWDGLTVRIGGTMLPDTYRHEPQEDFISQSLPYPEAGVKLLSYLTRHSSLAAEATGTFIPLFRSFFVEGGHMYLEYGTAEVTCSYEYSSGKFFVRPGLEYRWLKTYEDSWEDTNDFSVSAFGIRIVAGVR